MSDFQITRDPFGKLVYTGADGVAHVGVVPVRAFPIAAPDEGLSIVGPDGHELAWIPRLSALLNPERALLEAELAVREFTPTITRLRAVSTFSVPSTWSVDTDRGPTDVVLKSEDDIRRLGNGRLLIGTSHGLNLAIPDMAALDRASRRLLERFL
ncbi:DUF1854 domain-containing protein [uncultured Aquabacterium sp.]|jgi:hypothetical protein|uniref:cyanophycin metabolism-associated DUF1854 family protein n=1 Tax=uncultured Aquabacterium sp. TaxID=158753 RepID=UPI00260192D8|nr:DUF1854 domain-containing protein [uncultured Aquabacterium sp.]